MLRFNLFNKNIFRWLLPVAIVVLSVLLIQNIFSRKEYSVQELSPQDGVLDWIILKKEDRKSKRSVGQIGRQAIIMRMRAERVIKAVDILKNGKF